MFRFLLVAALTLASSLTPARADDADLSKRLDRIVLDSGLGQFWGAVLVARDGQPILAKGYGLADERLTPITRESLFDIGSVSKQFTAAAIYKLESQGKLSIADPVSKHFPGLGPAADAVTLHHLMTHTSGMHDEKAIQPLNFADRDEAVKRAITSVNPADVGDAFDYCNAGYIVLAAVIEKATGATFEDVLRDELFKPAGMTSTGFLDGAGLVAERRTARVVTGGRPGAGRRMSIFASPSGEPWAWGLKGAGGVLTTLDDLLKWDRALAADEVLTKAAREKLFTPEQQNYAGGWVVETTPAGQKMSHGGATRGYRAQLARYTTPSGEYVVAVLTNDLWDPTGLEKKLATEVMTELSDSATATFNLRGLGLNRYRAAEVDTGLTWNVAADGGRVRAMLTRDGGGGAIATLTLGKGTAAKLAADLLRHAPRATGAGISALLATLPYQLTDDSTLSLPTHLRPTVMSQYAGLNPETGERTLDPRTTLVLIDDDARFWPLIVKMSRPDARALAEKLTAAAQ
jgi:CubicO group peptidase (beta-lactamase class C family)